MSSPDSAAEFPNLLRYLYGGGLTLNKETAPGLLTLAVKVTNNIKYLLCNCWFVVWNFVDSIIVWQTDCWTDWRCRFDRSTEVVRICGPKWSQKFINKMRRWCHCWLCSRFNAIEKYHSVINRRIHPTSSLFLSFNSKLSVDVLFQGSIH